MPNESTDGFQLDLPVESDGTLERDEPDHRRRASSETVNLSPLLVESASGRTQLFGSRTPKVCFHPVSHQKPPVR